MKKPTFTLLLLLAGLLTNGSALKYSISGVVTTCEENDYLALRALYLSTNGDNWNTKTGWPDQAFFSANPTMPAGTDVNAWYGVSADANGVRNLSFNNNNMVGPIPPEIGLLCNIEFLSLYTNDFTGGIPPEIGDLTTLTFLSLRGVNDGLTGTIPDEIQNLTNLTHLSFSQNELSGSIPTWVGNLTNLVSLNFSSNDFTGPIPTSIGSLTNLTTLILLQNNLSGAIPPELGNLVNLTTFGLRRNELTGSIPPTLGNLTLLTNFDLSNNELSGSIPTELSNLTNLTRLTLSSNDLTGNIPSQLSSLSNLTDLNVSGNSLSLPIPSELGGLNNLVTFNASYNDLSGEIPAALTNLSSLKNLYLGSNELSGAIPIELGGMSNLEKIDLGYNNLTGGIPREIGNMTSLINLDLRKNLLTGSIPSELTQLSNLQIMEISDNDLTGCIDPSLQVLCSQLDPSRSTNNYISFGNDLLSHWEDFCANPSPICGCSQTEQDALVAIYNATGGGSWTDNTGWVDAATADDCDHCYWNGVICDDDGVVVGLSLSGNNLTGSIPSEIGDLPSLTYLQFGNNALTGSIPTQIGNLTLLIDLGLPNNNLSGPIPNEIGNLTNLVTFTAYNNDLSSSLPASIGNLSSINEFNIFGNQLSGSIPTEVGNMTSMTVLALNENNLDGPLPTSIGNLTNLTALNLHSNALSGIIPTEIGNLTSMEYLQLHNNQFNGAIPIALGSLTNAFLINLSQNLLSGCIPSELNTLCGIGGVNFSQNLCLSHNGNFSSFCAGDACDDPGTSCTCSDGILNGDETDTDCGGSCAACPPECNSNLDFDALVALYNSTNGDNWSVNTGWTLDCDVCNWHGLSCDANDRVIGINLYQNGLTGSLPVEIGDLDKLQTINMGFNNITGSLPTELGQLSELQEIDFWYNYLSGVIPPELANISTLTKIVLSDNDLGGSLPLFIGTMTQLEHFSAAQSGFTGTIPAEYAALTNLKSFGFSYNQLTGEVPDFFGNFSQMEILMLNGNMLTGSIPPSLGNLTSLTRLHLDFNDLTGGIPASLSNLTGLTSMGLRNNNLSGCVPLDFQNICGTNITIQDNPCLSHTSFSSFCISPTCVLPTEANCDFSACSNGAQDGQETDVDCGGNCLPCPMDCTSYPDFDVLMILYNALDGANWSNNNGWVEGAAGIDCDYCSWYGITCDANSRVTDLILFDVNVSGQLPTEIGQLTALNKLEITQNYLTGTLPTELGNLSNLKELVLFGNELTGPIPTSLSNLTQLTNLGLGSNQFSGEIPLFLTSMTQLTFLALNTNNFEGPIPPGLANLTSLQNLWLYQNNLSGCIPESLVVFCGSSTYIQLYENPCLSHNANFYDMCGGELCSLPTDSACDFSTCSNGIANAGEIEVDCGGICTPCQVDCTGNSDFDALMALYNSTNGPAWFGAYGWVGGAEGTNCDICNWRGIRCDQNGRVIEIFFKSIGMNGPLPSQLEDLTELRTLYIDYDQLSGPIPSSLGNLQHLESLSFTGNSLTGEIPSSFSGLTQLVHLGLSGNQLSGCYDPSLQQLCTQLNYPTNAAISDGNQFDASWEDFCSQGAEVCNCPSYFVDGQLPANHDLISITSNDCPTKGTIHFNNDPNDPCTNENWYWLMTSTETPPVDINDERIKSVLDDFMYLDPGTYYFYLISRPSVSSTNIVYLAPTTIIVDEVECFPCIDEVVIDEQADSNLDEETIRSADYIELNDVAVEQDLETFAVDYFEINGPFEVDPSVEFTVTISDECECTIGDPCDDEDPCTLNDTFDSECGCIGVLDPACLPDCASGFDHGDPCNDGDSCTENDVVDTNCNCVGTVINNCTSDCSSGLNFGDSCDDSDSCTDNDAIDTNCNCVGTDILDCEPDCTSGLNFGDSCDDGDDCTANDIITADCNCLGTDIAGCATDCASGQNFGDSCDDGNICTDDDYIDTNCNCVGTEVTDCESIACEDPDTLGTSCDDDDECTENDVWQFDELGECECKGDLIDTNNNGECDYIESCDEDGNIVAKTLKSKECVSTQGLDVIVSEFSNGEKGVDEYIELFVRGKGSFDLRGMIVDDKEGSYKSGNGFSAGRIRFANHPNWAAVKGGSIILIYNHKHKHQQIASDDPTDMNRDNIFITPLSQPYFYGEEKNNESKYYPIPPAWDLIWLYDKNDEINIRSCDERLLHRISYGYQLSSQSNLENTIHLDKSVLKGLVFSDMMNGHEVGKKEMSPGQYNNRRHRNFIKNGN